MYCQSTQSAHAPGLQVGQHWSSKTGTHPGVPTQRPQARPSQIAAPDVVAPTVASVNGPSSPSMLAAVEL